MDGVSPAAARAVSPRPLRTATSAAENMHTTARGGT